MRDNTSHSEKIGSGFQAASAATEHHQLARAVGHIQHIRDGKVIWEGRSLNVKTKAGIDYILAQAYGTSAAGAGLNYICLSDDTVTETADSTTLSNEITANCLGRAQATYAHTNGTGTATLTKTFTATGSQSCRKAAVFSASSNGTMTHVLALEQQRSLISGDSLVVTLTLGLS